MGASMAEPPIEHRFKPGHPGGPGRPPGRLTAKLVAKLAATEVLGKELPKGQTVEERVVEVVTAKALAGDFRFLRMLWERIEGKVPLTVANPDGTPLAVGGGPRPEDAALIAEAMRIFQAHDPGPSAENGGAAGPASVVPAPTDAEAADLPGPGSA